MRYSVSLSRIDKRIVGHSVDRGDLRSGFRRGQETRAELGQETRAELETP
jgi:hypothetical protein